MMNPNHFVPHSIIRATDRCTKVHARKFGETCVVPASPGYAKVVCTCVTYIADRLKVMSQTVVSLGLLQHRSRVFQHAPPDLVFSIMHHLTPERRKRRLPLPTIR